MEGYAAVITGAHLFERGSPRHTRGRSFNAYWSVDRRARLCYWASQAEAQRGGAPVGAVEAADISGVRVATPRRAGAEEERQLQFELRLADGKQRMIRIVPADAQQCQAWCHALTRITRGRHSAATSLVGAADARASEGWRDATVEKEGLLFTPYPGAGIADEPPWLAVRVRVERRRSEAGDSYVLRYGAAEAADLGGAPGGRLVNAEAIGMKTVHSVSFGFSGPGARAATSEATPGEKTLDRKSCHFQFSIADAALDGRDRVRQVATAAEPQGGGSAWQRRQQPPLPQLHGPADRVLRLRTRTTRECIEWVRLLRKLSVDRFLYPELLPVGVQRLLRALFHRALRNADGTVKEAEIGRQLQRDRVLSAVLPEEFRADPSTTVAETDDVAMAAVEAAAVAAWLFDGEDAAHEVLADAVAASAVDDGDEMLRIQTTAQASITYERSMTLETFVHEMNSRHHAALGPAAAPYEVCTASEALAKLRSDFDLPKHLDAAGAVWVVEEKLGLPHELPSSGPGADIGLLRATRATNESMEAAASPGGENPDRTVSSAGVPSPDTVESVAPVAAVDQTQAIDEALVPIFAHLGLRVVLVPEEDPSSSRAIAMEGLMRVLNADTAVGGGGSTGSSEALGQEQQLVNYDALDDDCDDGDHEVSQRQGQDGDTVFPSITKPGAASKATAEHGVGSYNSEAAASGGSPGGRGSDWGPLDSKGLRDRPYGSYRRSRRRAQPTPRQQQQQQAVQAAMNRRQQERGGIEGLGMVPSVEAPKSATLNARLAIGLRHSPYRSTSGVSEDEEVAMALTPTDTYRHLSHEEQKERRRRDFEDMMVAAAPQAEEPAAQCPDEASEPPDADERKAREEARRGAEEKRRKNAEDLALKKAEAEAESKEMALGKSGVAQRDYGNHSSAAELGGVDNSGDRKKSTGLGAADGHWSSRVGVGSSAAMVLAQIGL